MTMEYPTERKLDGTFFRVKRGDKWKSVCFSDLTKAERSEVCEGRSEEWLRSLAFILADGIRDIGDKLDLVAEYLW